MIKAIFYTRFHPAKGSRVLHQVPPGSITPSSAPCAQSTPLFDFASISEYVIPRQDFCDRLVTVCVNHYRVIGYPVCINNYDGRYDRNQFIFNFAFVVEEELLDWNSYASVVRKLGRLLRNLEEQSGFLSVEEKERDELELALAAAGGGSLAGALAKGPAVLEKIREVESLSSGRGSGSGGDGEESVQSLGLEGLRLDEPDEEEAVEVAEDDGFVQDGAVSKVYALCEMILEDLNNYCECMIPIDDSNTINLKLFPTRLPPAPVHGWHVPLLTIDLEMYTSPSAKTNRCATLSSDLTLTRILPFIDGINSVASIAQLADTDLGLTRKAIQHLLYYDTVVLLDIFQFGATYAPTPLISHFFTDDAALRECAQYVRIPRFLDASIGDAAQGETKKESGHSRKASVGSFTVTTAVGSPSQHSSPLHNRPNRSSTSGTHVTNITGLTANLVLAPDQPTVSHDTLIQLYSSLRQGVTLRSWVLENATLLTHIDVRRLITFGVIKGFLYRIHKYAITTSAGALAGTTVSYDGHDHLHGARWRGHNGYHSPYAATVEESEAEDTVGAHIGVGAAATAGTGRTGLGRELPLARYLDGLHCFDEVCTELGMGEREVLAKMKKGFGDVLVVHR
ncbi:nitrogen permease-like protein regulator Npr2 [Phyllosticta citrichinensis]|uniref:Nitrogen permease-like protein regulator Npr2 n=1 Tax=Phyllosticta citrichinensis TaxID=1130410 RepID=A0ABR1XPR9_9PEZI